MDDNNGILIIGASGLIGRYIYKNLKQDGFKVVGTYKNNKSDELIYYDLVNSNAGELPFIDIRYVIICSALSKIDECAKDVNYSRLVNVEGTKKLLNEISKLDIIPIFISAVVYDGIIGNYTEEDKSNPINVYGKQKKEIDEYIISNFEKYLIIRPGKVFGVNSGEGVLFKYWLDKYNKDEIIKCAYDEQISPNYVEDVARAIIELVKLKSNGVFNINPPYNFSRYDLALNFFKYLKITDANIIRCSIDDFNFLDKRPKNTYLDPSKFINETGFEFTDLEECYEMIRDGSKI